MGSRPAVATWLGLTYEALVRYDKSSLFSRFSSFFFSLSLETNELRVCVWRADVWVAAVVEVVVDIGRSRSDRTWVTRRGTLTLQGACRMLAGMAWPLGVSC